MPLIDTLLDRRVLVVTGKGGVGKSVVTAVLGRVLADAGRRVLLLEVDPRENLHQIFDLPPSGGEVVRARERLWLQNLRPRKVLDEIVEETLKIGPLVRRVLGSPVYAHFVEGAPGLREMAVLGHALRRLRETDGPARPDVVLLDAPATGHGVSMIAAPGLVADTIESGPFGRMASELAEFVDDPTACAVVAVTLAEEMPVQEVLELIERFDEQLDRRPEMVVVNGLYPSADGREPADDVDRLWMRRRETNERELARLRGAWTGPTVELPMLPFERGHELLEGLRAPLDAALRGGTP